MKRKHLHSLNVEVDVINVVHSVSSRTWNTSLFWFIPSMSITFSTVFLFCFMGLIRFLLSALCIFKTGRFEDLYKKIRGIQIRMKSFTADS